MATINLGAIKFNWKGAYNNSTAYVVDDVVSSGGSSYVCILASQGNAVSNGTYWSLMAQAGTDGTDVGTTLTTQGDILYRDGSGLQRLAAGTSGQVLQTGGSGANPSWGTLSSDFVKLNESTAGASTHEINGFFTSDYDNYVLIANNVQPNTTSDLKMRLMQSGSANTSSEYVYAGGLSYTDISPTHLWVASGALYSDWNSPDNNVNLGTDDQHTAATHVGQLKVNIYNPLSTTAWKYFDVDWKFNYSNNWNRCLVGGMLKNTSALSGIQFYYGSGTISSATNGFKLYGIK